YFTVPEDGGWSASVDGKPVSILRSGGMMLIPVPAGNHQILCTYLTPGFTMGCILTIMGGLCAGWIFVRHGARGRKRQEE
ncbi:MAG: YfhO family protein, partial [Lachnospiraceae bacterium]|nr:YfhO family protein [Lachnospiraceae bacterium]